jgi:ribosomal-protein-alanine N-acetyltransferase
MAREKKVMSIELVGARCTVRAFRQSDAHSLAACANDRGIWLQLRDVFPHPYTLADAEAYIGRVETVDAPHSLAIVVEGQAVGGIALQLGEDVNRRCAEVGYWLGSAHWGRGIASEVLAMVTAWAFEPFDLLRLYAQPFADNRASCRVLEKSGYVLEGTLRQSAVKDGQIRDQCLYACLRAE